VATQTDAEPGSARPASSPCVLHELGPDGRPRVDPEQARDVARWRKVERERLIAARRALTEEYRREQTLAIARAVERILATLALPTLSVYWPIRAEPDLRPWMGTLLRQGMRVALPVAIALGQPLVFREWRPHARLARGLWNIPYPADGAEVVPNVVIAPLVGFDPQCYRLGYGGGFFDRTLAALLPKPVAIGVGYSSAALSTTMDWVVVGSLDPIRCAPRA
jgi:5-formyltetrahydrofolate cyclo-ligase